MCLQCLNTCLGIFEESTRTMCFSYNRRACMGDHGVSWSDKEPSNDFRNPNLSKEAANMKYQNFSGSFKSRHVFDVLNFLFRSLVQNYNIEMKLSDVELDDINCYG